MLIEEEEDSYGPQDADPLGVGGAVGGPQRSPDPNNPMDYCSRIPPPQQAAGNAGAMGTPTVIVPVGVLKREGEPFFVWDNQNDVVSYLA